MDLDIAQALGRQLELRRLQERGRHAEPESLLERVIGAARENHAARAHRFMVREGQLRGPRHDLDGDHAAAADHRGPRPFGAPAHRFIERRASMTTASVVAVV